MNEYYGISNSSDFFMHYGIKGMKWGVRKKIDEYKKNHNIRKKQKEYYKAFRKLQKDVAHDPIKNWEHSYYARSKEIIPKDRQEYLISLHMNELKKGQRKRTETQEDHDSRLVNSGINKTMNDLLGKRRVKKLGYINTYRAFDWPYASEALDRFETELKKRRKINKYHVTYP